MCWYVYSRFPTPGLKHHCKRWDGNPLSTVLGWTHQRLEQIHHIHGMHFFRRLHAWFCSYPFVFESVCCLRWLSRGSSRNCRTLEFPFQLLHIVSSCILFGAQDICLLFIPFFKNSLCWFIENDKKWTGRTIFVHLHGPAKPSISESSTSWLRMSWWMQYNLQHQNWERKHQRRSSWTTSSRAGTDLCPLLPIVKCSNSVNKKDMWRRFAGAAVVMQQCAWCL